MNKTLLLGFALVGFALVGCGGSGGSSGSGNTGVGGTANAYAGFYSGEFVDQNFTTAKVQMTISSTGGISGTFLYSTPETFTGSVNSSGTGTIKDNDGTLPITFGASGRTTLAAGIGTSTLGSFLTMASHPNGQFSGFTGDYAGTIHNVTQSRTGILAFSVSSSGALAGAELFDVDGKATLEPISGALSSSGKLSYVVDGVTISGTVALSSTTMSGSLSESDGDSATLSVSQVAAE